MQKDGQELESQVVALTLGSKSTGLKYLRPDGLCLHDCHSEILARRSLLKWLQFNWDAVFEEVNESFGVSNQQKDGRDCESGCSPSIDTPIEPK